MKIFFDSRSKPGSVLPSVEVYLNTNEDLHKELQVRMDDSTLYLQHGGQFQVGQP